MAEEDWDAVAAAHQKLAEINGYDATAIAQQFNAKPSEVRAFLAGSLDPDRGRELTEQLRQAGVPV